VQATYSDTGIGNQHMLTASIPAVADAISGPVEYRLYSWGATATTGNTHVDAASLTGKFVSIPTLEFNFAGVQDGAPLTALKRQSANAALASGLNFGPGVAPRGANNVGNEFNVAGFSTGSTLQAAIDGNDYLSFAVKPIAGMAMYPDSASFTLWRQGAGSSTNYAIMSSVSGFASGQQLAQIQTAATGSANQTAIIGSFANASPTTAAVEFRLYGWNAATSLDDTHLIAASMRARFASVVGSQIDPTGELTVQGDLYHLPGSTLAIDLGGTIGGVTYDALHALGKVELEGDLSVSLASLAWGGLFTPQFGDSFKILTADDGLAGQFAHISLPSLAVGLDWSVKYSTTHVTLNVLAAADFNQDGVVDSGDLTLWKAGIGHVGVAMKGDGDANDDGVVDGRDFLVWQSQLGMSIPGIAISSAPVPEPDGCLMAVVLSALDSVAVRRRR
jgi:hypothetical protein